MTLRIELSEEQLQLLINALEVNFRFMMGQGDIVADLLSQCPDKSKFDDERAWDRVFERYLLSRAFAGMLLKDCSRTLYGEVQHEDTHRLSDMWSVLRHAKYNLQQHKDYWDVRRYAPSQMSDWNLIKVEVE
jgi:hypothetical protein